MLLRSPMVWRKLLSGISAALTDIWPPWGRFYCTYAAGCTRDPPRRRQSTRAIGLVATVANAIGTPRLTLRDPHGVAGGQPSRWVISRLMPKLLLVTVPTDEVLNKKGEVRFPGTEAAVEKLTEAGWEVVVVDATWPKPLEAAKDGGYDLSL